MYCVLQLGRAPRTLRILFSQTPSPPLPNHSPLYGIDNSVKTDVEWQAWPQRQEETTQLVWPVHPSGGGGRGGWLLVHGDALDLVDSDNAVKSSVMFTKLCRHLRT